MFKRKKKTQQKQPLESCAEPKKMYTQNPGMPED